MIGYLGTPLAKKLGIKDGFRVALVNSPAKFQDELGTLSAETKLVSPSQKRLDFILCRIGITSLKELYETRRETRAERDALDSVGEKKFRLADGFIF